MIEDLDSLIAALQEERKKLGNVRVGMVGREGPNDISHLTFNPDRKEYSIDARRVVPAPTLYLV